MEEIDRCGSALVGDVIALRVPSAAWPALNAAVPLGDVLLLSAVHDNIKPVLSPAPGKSGDVAAAVGAAYRAYAFQDGNLVLGRLLPMPTESLARALLNEAAMDAGGSLPTLVALVPGSNGRVLLMRGDNGGMVRLGDAAHRLCAYPRTACCRL